MNDSSEPAHLGTGAVLVAAVAIGGIIGLVLGLLIGSVWSSSSATARDGCKVIGQATALAQELPTEGFDRGSSEAIAAAAKWRDMAARVDEVPVADPDLDGALSVWSTSMGRAADMLLHPGDPAEQDSAESAITPRPPAEVTSRADC